MRVKAEEKYNISGRGTIYTAEVIYYQLDDIYQKDIEIEYKGEILKGKCIGIERFARMYQPKDILNIGIVFREDKK